MNKNEVVHLLFLGIEIDRKGARRNCWVHLTDYQQQNNGQPIEIGSEFDDDRIKVYKNKRPWLPGLNPGAIIVIERDNLESFSLYGNTAQLVGHWQCREQVAQWQSQHKAHALLEEARRSNKANVDLSCLDPIKNAYWRLNSRARKALMVRVLCYIEGDQLQK